MEWLFDGLGSTLLGVLFGALLGTGAGGFFGFRIGVHRNRQSQSAQNYARQTQIGRDMNRSNLDE